MGIVLVRIIGSERDVRKVLDRLGYDKKVRFYNCYNSKFKRVYIKIRV